MCKKIALGALGLALVGGLLFGGRLIPYTQTAYNNLRDAANDSIPVSFQIDAARDQLKKIGPEIKSMVHQVAKEKVQIERLAAQLDKENQSLQSSYDEMMTLRQHLESGEQYYVATDSKKFSRSRVEEDLRYRFTLYRTAEATLKQNEEVLSIRRKSMEAALEKLEEAKAQQRELEVQIENLVARNRMNEVIRTASQLDIDNSQLAKTREMIEDIGLSIATEEEELSIAPKYYGKIKVSPENEVSDSDILDDMDAYFDSQSNDDVDADLFDDKDEI